MRDNRQWLAIGGGFTSFPLVSPFSIHSTVTLSLSSWREVTIAWWIRPAKRGERMQRDAEAWPFSHGDRCWVLVHVHAGRPCFTSTSKLKTDTMKPQERLGAGCR